MLDIIYQIPGDVSAGPLGAAELFRRQALLQSWTEASIRVMVRDSPGGPLSIESYSEEALCVAPMMRALRESNHQPDAVIVGCYGDPGLAALREVMDCPVVGPLESSFHLALQLGTRVGILTVLDQVVPLLDQLVRSLGLENHYQGSLAVNIPVLDLPGDPKNLLELASSKVRCLVDRGANVISLGCMSMAFQELSEALTERLGVPVINPARCALKTAEMMLSMKLNSSRVAFPRPRKPLPV